MIRKILPFVFILFYHFSSSQLKQGEFTIGGAVTLGCSVIQVSNGGYVFGGSTQSFGAGNYDVYVAKVDSSFNLLWTKTIGGTGIDQAYCMIQSSDNGYVLSGLTYSFGHGFSDVYIIKLDSFGNLKWTRTIGGTKVDYASSIIQTSDKGYAICGATASYGAGGNDVYIIKLDSLGNLLWTRTVGGAGDDEGASIVETYDRGLAIAGFTNSFGAGNYDVYVIKMDSSGHLKWTKTIGGPNIDLGYSIIQTPDRGLVIGGQTASIIDTNGVVYLIKLDSVGNLKWTRAIGDRLGEGVLSVINTKDNGFALAGITYSYSDTVNGDMYILKLDSNGNIQWTQTTGGLKQDNAYSIIQTKNGGYGVVGTTNSYPSGQYKIFFVLLDSIGKTCNPDSTGGHVDSVGVIGSGGMVSTGGLIDTGGIVKSGGSLNIICGGPSAINEVTIESQVIEIFPNPSTGQFTLSLSNVSKKCNVEVYNVLGERVFTLTPTPSPYGEGNGRDRVIDLSAEPNGIYLYRVMDASGALIGSGKFVIQK